MSTMNQPSVQSAASASGGYLSGQSLSGRRIRIRFLGSVHAEFVKLTSLASTWWILGIAVVLVPTISGLGAWALRFVSFLDKNGQTLATPNPIEGSVFWGVLSAAVSMLSFITGILGVMSITTEYSTTSIQASLTVNPRRTMLMNAKALALLIVTLISTLVAQLIAYAVARMVLIGVPITPGPFDAENGVLPYVVMFGSPVCFTLVALLSLGLGGICRSTVGGVFALFGLFTIAPMIVRLGSSFLSGAGWLHTVSAILPDGALSNFLLGGDSQRPSGVQGFVLTPNWWQSGLILLAWTVVVYVIGVLVVNHRDIK